MTDQSRVPKIGDQFEGTLFQHTNSQWMMADAAFLPETEAEPLFQTALTESGHPHNGNCFLTNRAAAYCGKHVQTLQSTRTGNFNGFTGSVEITSWDDIKGYGFIRYGNDAQTVFFHISTFHCDTTRLKIGKKVSFYCKKAQQKAEKVVLHGDKAFLFDDFSSDYIRPRLSTANMSKFLINSLISATFTVLVPSASKILASLYIAISAVPYLMYKFDKQITQNSKKKSQEYQGRILEKICIFSIGWAVGRAH
ncbi:cold shock domain-containing protein [Neisseria iguanae]|uniref:CSD domain-containing protein n=1 Tax=Neisseria iguanae TaxID=90242 RepID=A0A2P7U1C8_9NEIS|nr:cold shock domain-containing protein [Neisseria iguanae]PSJ80769.1 hypothetical protein C7N83_04245 [Neisseria iguanae]